MDKFFNKIYIFNLKFSKVNKVNEIGKGLCGELGNKQSNIQVIPYHKVQCYKERKMVPS